MSEARKKRARKVARIAGAFIPAIIVAACGGDSSPEGSAHNPRNVLRVNGSTTVNPVVTEIANILTRENQMMITVDTQGGSSGGISGVADGSAGIGMSSKPLSRSDRERYPDADFHAFVIGIDAVALAVNENVWNGRVRHVTREQVREIYEKEITNWKEIGGPDSPIVFLDKEPGRGTWEVFADWLYPDGDAPTISHSQVGGNEEGRTKAATTGGAITQLSASWVADSPGIDALGIVAENGEIVEPTHEAIQRDAYPIRRPLLLITNGPPDPEEQKLIDFALSERGREIVAKHGYLAPSEPAGTDGPR
ncbi:MAG: substrate-binding domain-containing protein [Acidobacteria bacterium]|nr:substrate-binding domain-containing protein [Acidobacteriota bacterium]